ncbi:hypothetical protein UY3_10575 [Chelonia mydas]|uniref:Uncharacterized protein n=1 Tax=Chelonia mydas TaxID=8469 RepID=M7BVX9_CHEMY|nr:hypothetical protein UY3_10575 [Chelonia mydas]
MTEFAPSFVTWALSSEFINTHLHHIPNLIGSDIIFLEGSMDLWYDAANVFQGKEVICHGFDDDYSFCGTLKGGHSSMSLFLLFPISKFPFVTQR